MKKKLNKLKMTKCSLKNIVFFIGVLGVGFVLIYILAQLGGVLEKNRLSKIRKHRKYVTSTVIKTGNMKGNYVVVEYYFKDIRYERKEGSPSPAYCIGEHYEIMLDSLDPSQSEINFTKPIFLLNDSTNLTMGKITQAYDHTVRYSYRVNEIEYYKFQKVDTVASIYEQNLFQVEYLVSDPRISIIHLTQ